MPDQVICEHESISIFRSGDGVDGWDSHAECLEEQVLGAFQLSPGPESYRFF